MPMLKSTLKKVRSEAMLGSLVENPFRRTSLLRKRQNKCEEDIIEEEEESPRRPLKEQRYDFLQKSDWERGEVDPVGPERKPSDLDFYRDPDLIPNIFTEGNYE